MSTTTQSSLNSLNWTILGVWGTKFGALVIFFILARLLTPTEFGTVALAIVLLSLFQNMFASSFGNSIVRRATIGDRYCDTVFWLLFGLSLIVAVTMYFSAGVLEKYLNIEDVKEVFQASSLIVLLYGITFAHYGYVLRSMNFRVLALRNLISVIGGGVIGIIAAAMGFGWWALIIQQGVTAALNAFLLWIASDWRPSLSFGKADARDCFAYSRWMILWALMAFFERQLDILVVSSMIGTAAAGYYSTAQRLTMILYDLATSVVGQLFLPIFSRLQDNREELASVFCQIFPATAMLLLPACVGLACVAPEAVGVVLGEKWLPAAPVVSLLSLYVAISGICFLNFQLMTALNKPNWIVAWTIPLIVTNIAFMIPAAKYGISAIAAVLLIRTALLMPLSIISVKRLIPISAKDLGISLIPSVTACLAMVAAIMGTKEAVSGHLTDFWTLALLLPLGCAVYFGTMRLLFSMHLRNNIDYLRQLNQRL